MTIHRRPLAPVLLVALTLVPGTAAAADELEQVGQLARLVRWSGVLTSMFVMIGVWIGLRFMRDFVERLSRQFVNRRFLFQQIATVIQFVVYIVSALTVLFLSFHIDERALTVIGGTIAVAVGFAIKDVVASFIAGITIMIDRPFQVGDRVKFGGEYGDITAIGLRSVRLQTLDDSTVTIPNNKFLSDITSNANYGALDMQVVIDFHIGPDQDVAAAREIVSEAAVSSRYAFLPKPVVVLVNQVLLESHVALRLRLKAYVLDTRYEKGFETDITLRVMEAFATRGIAPPAILHRPVTEPATAMLSRAG